MTRPDVPVLPYQLHFFSSKGNEKGDQKERGTSTIGLVTLR